MGIGPVFAVPRLLERNGLTVSDIDLWELNEAFASQSLYCRDTLGIDPDKVNVTGGESASWPRPSQVNLLGRQIAVPVLQSR